MNTPNKITLSRLLLIPLIVFFYLATFIPYARLVATILFIIACLTDFVDGKIARKTNQVTDLGKFFDTIADKVLIATGFVLICAVPLSTGNSVVYPNWLGVICIIVILAREFIVSALRQIAASKGIVLAADKGGKVKATFQFVIVSIYMAYSFVLTDLIAKPTLDLNPKVFGILNFVFMIMLVATTLLTVYSGATYLIRNRKIFKDTNKQKNVASHIVEPSETVEEMPVATKLENEQPIVTEKPKRKKGE